MGGFKVCNLKSCGQPVITNTANSEAITTLFTRQPF